MVSDLRPGVMWVLGRERKVQGGVYQKEILATRKQLWGWLGLRSETIFRSRRAPCARKDTGREVSMPRLRSSLESTDMNPRAKGTWWLSPAVCAQGDRSPANEAKWFLWLVSSASSGRRACGRHCSLGQNETCGWIMCSFSPRSHIITNNDLSPRET